MSAKLYLLPAPLGDNSPEEVIPAYAMSSIAHVKHFAVEDLRSARRYLSKIGFRGRIDELSFYEVNEHSAAEDIAAAFGPLKAGEDMVLVSEAGLPAVADPGAGLVELAHVHDIEVIPFVGPSSLMMALMSSGMNGQCFAFAGYIPAKADARRKAIKDLEARSRKYNETEIMIETPYRSDAIFADLLSVCDDNTRICVAADITLPEQYIKTRRVSQWKKNGLTINKRPCVFLIYAGQ